MLALLVACGADGAASGGAADGGPETNVATREIDETGGEDAGAPSAPAGDETRPPPDAGPPAPLPAWEKSFANVKWQHASFDAQGNVVALGLYGPTADVGGGALPPIVNDPKQELESEGVLLAKFDPSGAHLWSKAVGVGVLENTSSLHVVVDRAGNVFLAGTFASKLAIGGRSLSNAGNSDFFIAKFSPDGGHLWSKSFGDKLEQLTIRLAPDSAGNVVVYSQSIGEGVEIALGGKTLKAIFLAKLDSTGKVLWSRSLPQSLAACEGCLAVDAKDGVLFAGITEGPLGLPGNVGGTAPKSGTAAGFVAKVDSDGNGLWTRYVGSGVSGLAADSAGEGVALAFDDAKWEKRVVVRLSDAGAIRWKAPYARGAKDSEPLEPVIGVDEHGAFAIRVQYRSQNEETGEKLDPESYIDRWSSVGAPAAPIKLGGFAVEALSDSWTPVTTGPGDRMTMIEFKLFGENRLFVRAVP